MVSVKERKVKGRTYMYVSASATFKGETKRFEKSIGPKDMGKKKLRRRVDFYSEVLETKKEYYLIYLETKSVRFKYLPSGYAFPLILTKRLYHSGLNKLYPSELKKYQNEFDVRYVHNTTAIEGNTLTLKETGLVLDDGIAPARKELREIHEVENYRKVLKFVREYKKDVNLDFILKIHSLIQRNIDDNTAGTFRRIVIGIRGSKWEPPPPIQVNEDLKKLLKWYNNNKVRLHPIELAGIFHHKFLQIHPFVDGNGRVGRELLNFILGHNGYPSLIIPVERREEYLKYLEKADMGDNKPLLEYFVEILVEDHIKVIRGLKGDIQKEMGELSIEEMREFLDFTIWFTDLISKYMKKIPPNLQKRIGEIFMQ